MTSEGNVADTGILQEIYQLRREGLTDDKCEALKIILEDAKRRGDTAGGTHLNFMLTEYGMLEGNS